jgi:isopenicillin N synthase-like dioxygenase
MSLREGIPDNALNLFKQNGFLLFNVSALSWQVINATIAAACSFFRKPLAEKLANKLPAENGYRPFGIEYSRSPATPDQIESFTVNGRIGHSISSLPSTSAQILCERMVSAFDILESIAEVLTIQIAAAVSGGKVGDKLRGGFHRWSRLQLNYSKPAEVGSPFINEPHEDGTLITLACATGPGLELQRNAKEFVPLTTATGEMIAMPGEITWLLSGGQIPPLYHRVRPENRENERIALLFFGDIDPRLCQPWIHNEVNAAVDIGGRVLQSVQRFGLEGFASE